MGSLQNMKYKVFCLDLFSSINKLTEHYLSQQSKCFLFPQTEEKHPNHQLNKMINDNEKNKKIQPNDHPVVNKVPQDKKISDTKKQDKKGNEGEQIEVKEKGGNRNEHKKANIEKLQTI